jgi:hypothetical protein
MAKRKPVSPVQFTLESAERIANVVRSAEVTPANAAPLSFAKRFPERIPKAIRAATFSGSWPIGSDKSVTFTSLPTATASVTNLSWPITSSGYSNEPCIVGKDGTAWYLVVPRLETATSVFVTATRPITFVSETQSRVVVSGYNEVVVLTSVDVQGSISGSVPITIYTTGHTASCTSVSDVQISAELNTSNCAITVSKTVSTSACTYLSSVDVSAEADTSLLAVSINRTNHTATVRVVSQTTALSVCSAFDTAIAIASTATSSFLRIRVP